MLIFYNVKNQVYFVHIKKDNISYNKEIIPIIKGSFKIIDDNINIDNIIIYKSNIKTHLSKNQLLKLIRKQNIYVYSFNNLIDDFLNYYNVNYHFIDLCDKCLKNNIIKILNHENYYEYNKKHACYECIKNEIKEALIENSYNLVSLNKFLKLLDKTRDTSLIFDLIYNNYNSIEDSHLTLYDKFETKKLNYRKVPIEEINIPTVFKNILKSNIEYLLPIQILALNSGLLYNENLLIVSPTASGKTLIGELTGIKNVLRNKKFIYLSPLVALANQKYRYFKDTYSSLGIKVVIKVGSNRIHAENELTIIEESIVDADIIVATYEGLDYILRSSKGYLLNSLGVVVIDEIHMLENKERGTRLNGLINRLIYLFPEAQLIGLSATIKNPHELSDKFNMKLVEFDNRPVTLERHVVFNEDDNDKINNIIYRCKKEFELISDKGYHGQTIIFTDSRRNTQEITKKLTKNGISASSYHSGLTYSKKIDIEDKYLNQEISTVVTTAALAAGVDFPASQVIFDSMRMGKDWLTNNEFFQMMGRAGRPTYHDIGKIYLLPTLKKNFNGIYEEDVTFKLLEATVDSIDVVYNANNLYEQVLSDISAAGKIDYDLIHKKYEDIDKTITINQCLNRLLENNLINYNINDNMYEITKYGRAVSVSFLDIDTAEIIKNNISMDLIDLIVMIEPINNAYLSNRLIKSFKRILNSNISTRLFSDSSKEIITNGEIIKKLSKKHEIMLLNVYMDFMNCSCDEKPYCNCMEKNISKHILNRRLEGWDPLDISNEFRNSYQIDIYSGDIFNWLDQIIRYLEAILRISKVYYNDSVYIKTKLIIDKIIGN